MAVTPKILVASQFLPTSTGVLYTVPAGTKTIIDKATITHATSDTGITATIYIDGSTTTQLVINQVGIVSKQTYLCPELVGQVLEEGDTIQGKSNGNPVLTIRISGREVT